MSYLIDTNVLSEATQKAPAKSVLHWLGLHADTAFVSVITLGEIEQGIWIQKDPIRRTKLWAWFQGLRSAFAPRILPIDDEVMQTWARLVARHQGQGRKLNQFDSLLAATAEHHGMTMVTRNVRHFPDDLALLNPWGT